MADLVGERGAQVLTAAARRPSVDQAISGLKQIVARDQRHDAVLGRRSVMPDVGEGDAARLGLGADQDVRPLASRGPAKRDVRRAAPHREGLRRDCGPATPDRRPRRDSAAIGASVRS